jgi:hypothetical protein
MGEYNSQKSWIRGGLSGKEDNFMLFITKSANSFDFLRQNLEILGGREGDVVQTHYRSRWIEPIITSSLPKRGSEACIIFSDPPYDFYVPIRHVTFIEDIKLDAEGKYLLKLELGPRVFFDEVNIFTNQMQQSSKKQFFVFRNSDAKLKLSNLPEKEAWRKTIRHMVGLEDQESGKFQLTRYLSSLFLRPEEIYESDDAPIDLNKHKLKIGHEYSFVIDCYAPNLSEEKISSLEIVGKSDPPLLGIKGVLASQDGRLSVKVLPAYGGETNLKIWVQPEQTRSSEVTYKCNVELAEQETKSFPPTIHPPVIPLEQPSNLIFQAETGLSAVQAQTLYRSLLALMSKNSPQPILLKYELSRELERFCSDADGQRFLQEERGVSASLLGQHDEAYQILNSIGIEKIRSQDGVASYFISAWQQNKTPDIRLLVSRFISEENEDLTVKIRETLPWRTIIDQKSVFEDLYLTKIFAIEKLPEIIFNEVDGRVVADWIEYTTENLKILEAEDAFRLLRDWLKQEKYLANEGFVARLAIKFGIQGKEDVAFIVNQYGPEIITGREIDKAVSYKQDALNLDSQRKIRFYESLAEITQQFDQDEWRIFTAELYMEVARYYLKQVNTTENLEIAGIAIQNVERYASEKYKKELDSLKDDWKKQSEETPIIKEYLLQFEEKKLSLLREIVHGKKILFIGGLTRWFDADSFAHEIGFSFGEHIEINRGKGGNLKSVTKRIKEGAFDYVIDIISFGRHHNEVREACSKKVVYIMHTSRSFHKSAFLKDLFEYHKSDLRQEPK